MSERLRDQSDDLAETLDDIDKGKEPEQMFDQMFFAGLVGEGRQT
jgi:hypothetical protein